MQIVVLMALIPGIGTFKMGKVEMKEPFITGNQVSYIVPMTWRALSCTVKLYKDGQEFYRFMPGVSDHRDVFTVAGVAIDLQQSNKHILHLATIDRDTEGIFMCEVSTEAPHFYTGVEMVNVRVISEDFTETRETKILFLAIPAGTFITGLSPSYEVGDMVEANCSTRKSLPSPSITWYINSKKVEETEDIFSAKTVLFTSRRGNGLLDSSLQLRVKTRRQHFKVGE